MRLLGNEEDAREVVQEVFCQFWRGRGKFEGRASMFTFLYRIATNLSIDRLRRRTTRGDSVTLDEERDAVPAGARSQVGPEEQVAAAAEVAELTRGLDEETIMIAVMSHVDGLTQEEIADALGLSRRTIGKRLSKFIAHTRKRAERVAQGEPA